MKYVTMLIASMAAAWGVTAHAQLLRDVHVPSLQRTPLHPRSLAAQGAANHPAVTPSSGMALPANVTTVPCPEGNSVCGYVTVPLDRKLPHGATINVYFEQYFHSNPGPAVSAIMANFGGPGFSTTDSRDGFQGQFGPNMDVHDLLLVDDRGRGQSGAIDCQELQHGGVGLATAEADCAAQLGAAASRYGSGDIAEDMNDVRAALGYELIDYYGGSWGGADAIAFATRYPEHIRSLVLDSPVGPPIVIPYTRRLSFEAGSIPSVLSALCSRSLLCAPDHPNPPEELSALVEAVRAHPVEGDSHDASGNPLHVRVDERALLDFVVFDSAFHGNFTTKNEALAAYVALEHGDAVPLLRLAAEGFFAVDPTDSGDPTGFSNGAFYATGCSDVGEPWHWSDGVSDRMEAYNEYIAELPSDYFAPFSKSVGGDILFSVFGKQCFWWQEPTPSSPIARANTKYPSAPTLVLAGDLDDRLGPAPSKVVAALFPNSTYVTVVNARHETTGWTICASSLLNRMIQTLSPGDTSCSNTSEYIWPAVGRFPLLAKDARAATPDNSGTNQVGESERKVVSVAVATSVDALERLVIGSGSDVGLRGGTFSTTFSPDGSTAIVTLTNCAFSQDVVVNGTVSWAVFVDSSVNATLTVSGPGTAGGTLQISGFWNGLGFEGVPLNNFEVTGTLGGKKVALLVPEA